MEKKKIYLGFLFFSVVVLVVRGTSTTANQIAK
jgi:hypothetical protein